MIPLHRLLWGSRQLLDFALECGWLVCDGSRLPNSDDWQLSFNVLLTKKEPFRVTVTRQNPTDTLRIRLMEEGITTHFDQDYGVRWLTVRVATVDLLDLMAVVRRVAAADPTPYCEPIRFDDDHSHQDDSKNCKVSVSAEIERRNRLERGNSDDEDRQD